MRLSVAICLFMILFYISSTSAKKKINRKARPDINKKTHVNKYTQHQKKQKPPTEVKEVKDDTKQEKVKAGGNKDKENKEEEYEEEEEDEEDLEQEEDEEDLDQEEDKEEGDVSEEDSDDDTDNVDDKDVSENGGSKREDTEEDSSDSEEDNKTDLSSEEFKGDTRAKIQEKGVFYSLESIKEFFRGSDYRGITEVEDMIQRYNHSEFQVKEKMAAKVGKQMHPFYVVEGVNADTRRKVAQILAHRVKGLYFVNQPRISLGPVLKGEVAKRAYYSFSKYSIANKVKMSIFSKPIVIESYWMDHAAYIMAKLWDNASKMPKPGSELYTFPEDLLVPNVTFVIFNSPPPRLGKNPSKTYLFEQRMLLVYKRFTGAKIQVIRFPESAKLIADKIDLHLHGQDITQPRPKHFDIDYNTG